VQGLTAGISCISDKPPLAQPKYTETPLHIFLDNTSTTILYILSRDQFSFCQNEERWGKGRGPEVFSYPVPFSSNFNYTDP